MDKSSNGHVRFRDASQAHTEDITVEPGPDGESLDVQLGFLQCGHIYLVEVPIPHNLGAGFECLNNPKVCMLRTIPLSSGLDEFHFELTVLAEGLMMVAVRLLSAEKSKNCLIVRFHAKVLGKLMGTPALKNGIKSIGVQDDVSLASELSDSEL